MSEEKVSYKTLPKETLEEEPPESRFLSFLENRISRKTAQNIQHADGDRRIYNMLKTEIAELDVIRINFLKIFGIK